MSEDLPNNRFPKPQEWNELVDIAREALDPGQRYSDQVQANMVVTDAIKSIKDDERFDLTRYFALSKAACFVAQAAMDEERRIIETTANALRLRDQNYDNLSEGLRIGGTEVAFNLRRAAPWVGRIVTASESYQSMDPAERLVMNGFAGVSIELERKLKQRDKGLVVERLPTDDAVHSVVEVLMSGASLIMKEVLATIYEEQFGGFSCVYTPIKNFITPEQIEKLDLTRVGTYAASMRLDEVDYIRDFLKLKEPWVVEFDTKLKHEDGRPGELTPEARRDLKICHEARIGCPALYVKGALPFVLGLMPHIVAKAQRHLLAQA